MIDEYLKYFVLFLYVLVLCTLYGLTDLTKIMKEHFQMHIDELKDKK